MSIYTPLAKFNKKTILPPIIYTIEYIIDIQGLMNIIRNSGYNTDFWGREKHPPRGRKNFIMYVPPTYDTYFILYYIFYILFNSLLRSSFLDFSTSNLIQFQLHSMLLPLSTSAFLSNSSHISSSS